MATLFFYSSMVIIWIGFAIILYFRPLNLASIITGVATIAYSVLFDIFLGDYCKLYFYISRENSPIFIALAAVFIYSFLNMAYTMFLPHKKGAIIIYTAAWAIAMLAFELTSFWARTIVLTGWRIIPWSFLTYIFTYSWVYLFYIYLIKKGLGDIKYFERP